MPHRVFEFLRNGARVPIVIIAGPALLAVAMIAVAVALVQLRADALADTRRDIANLARVFADQTGRSVQAIDLILRDLQDSVAEKQGSTIETFGRVVGSDVVHRELKEKIARLPNVDAFLIVDSTDAWPTPRAPTRISASICPIASTSDTSARVTIVACSSACRRRTAPPAPGRPIFPAASARRAGTFSVS
jgi:hypothetical protein